MTTTFICAVLIALRDIAVRYVPQDLSSLQIAFTHGWIVTLGGFALTFYQGARPMPAHWWPWVALMAVLVFAGYYCNVVGTRIGELSYVAPFKYAGVPLAFVIGYLVWGDRVSSTMLLGAGVIVAAGIALVVTENRRSRRARIERDAETN